MIEVPLGDLEDLEDLWDLGGPGDQEDPEIWAQVRQGMITYKGAFA